MTEPLRQPMPAGYRIRVAGHLDQHWSHWFGDLTLAQEVDGTTSLAGAVIDQAELHGLLTKVRDLGVTLISVEALDPAMVEQQEKADLGKVLDPDSAPAVFPPAGPEARGWM